MACSNQDRNKEKCPCKQTKCERHGVCCECVNYHRERGNKPVCIK